MWNKDGHPTDLQLQQLQAAMLEPRAGACIEPRASARVEAHVQDCAHCQDVLRQYEALDRLLAQAAKTWSEAPIPVDLSSELVSSVLRSQAARLAEAALWATLPTPTKAQTLAGALSGLLGAWVMVLRPWSLEGSLDSSHFGQWATAAATVARGCEILLEVLVGQVAAVSGPALLMAASSLLLLAMLAGQRWARELTV